MLVFMVILSLLGYAQSEIRLRRVMSAGTETRTFHPDDAG